MHAFVSSRYVVMENVSPREGWLLTPFGHERLVG
jgi:hypothetical protein